jgi:hypothetical protein
VAVQSASLRWVAYCRVQRLLEVIFQDGSRYQFRPVPLEGFEALLAAESKGTYFNRFIRNRYKYQQLSPTAPKTK